MDPTSFHMFPSTACMARAWTDEGCCLKFEKNGGFFNVSREQESFFFFGLSADVLKGGKLDFVSRHFLSVYVVFKIAPCLACNVRRPYEIQIFLSSWKKDTRS